MAQKFFNYIDGQWLAAKSEKTFENRNPAKRDDLIGSFPASSVADVDAAVQAATKAFASWRLVPAPKRGEILYRVGELLKKNKEELARIETREMGKVLKETRGDVQEGIDCAFLNAGEGRRLFGETTPAEMPNKFAMSVRTPIGVCALITPWNFPLAIPTWKFVSRADLRQHGDTQTGGRYAAHRDPIRRNSHRSRRAARRGQFDSWPRRRSRCRAGAP